MSNPYEDLPPRQFWRSGVAAHTPETIEDVYRPRFAISKTDRITVAGSCFAQHVGRNLRQREFAVMDNERQLPGMTEEVALSFGMRMYSARYGNIYTARQLLQLFTDAASGSVRDADFFERDGRIYDGLRPTIEPGGFDSLEAARQQRRAHLHQVHRLMKKMDVLVFTFGLTEAWCNRQNGTVYPVCPGVVAGEFDPSLHAFVNFSYDETKADFEAVMAMMRAINRNIRFLVTVSPVPLTATAVDAHVLAATTYSKSVLRAVCGALYEAEPALDYFPSYELVTAPFTKGRYFADNMRSVTPEGVANAMRVFFEAHDPGAKPRKAAKAPGAGALKAEDDVVCEELLLDAFASKPKGNGD